MQQSCFFTLEQFEYQVGDRNQFKVPLNIYLISLANSKKSVVLLIMATLFLHIITKSIALQMKLLSLLLCLKKETFLSSFQNLNLIQQILQFLQLRNLFLGIDSP
jgi:hypothetical protein